jgi:hypothetical protein
MIINSIQSATTGGVGGLRKPSIVEYWNDGMMCNLLTFATFHYSIIPLFPNQTGGSKAEL